ncbi:sensor histidine kinase [Sphingomonas jaspsi]|uniref:sensor histidine kinase n=1 Tax=Sphingomonas jaspsi TaxID=392409 RepID=UPI0004B3C926|nr:sensor histidine kinase [Sphingomonas jaspsi]
MSESRFNRATYAVLGAAFLLLAIAFAAAVSLSRIATSAGDRVEHTFEVISTISLLETDIERSETAVRGWLLAPEPQRLANYKKFSSRIAPTLEAAESLVADNRKQVRAIQNLKPDLIEEVETLDAIVALAERGDRQGALRLFLDTANKFNVTTIRNETDAMRAEERRLLTQRRAAEGRALRNFALVVAITAGLLAAVAIGVFFLVRRYTSTILASRARLHLLNTNLEGAVAERTSDLKRANDEIQRFAYVVSHDLRSPLVNVMGFTAELERADKVVSDFIGKVEEAQPDLVTQDVTYAAREDLPEAIGFIRSSTQKMDRLINAILDLSRQGRRVLTPEHLPMERILQDIADSLATQSDLRGATITIETPLPDLRHDRLAVEQIFQNLMENATKYLSPDRPGQIVVRGRREGKRAIYEVEDNGRGIAPEDHERVFELFRRSGQQDQKGEGIGLANVRALAYRLGGTVTVRSTLSEGSTFVVDLPTEFSGEDKE